MTRNRGIGAYLIGGAAAALLLSSGGATAQEAFKLCSAVKDDGDRLKCYDGVMAAAKSVTQPDARQPSKVWEIKNEKSPLDDSPSVIATLPTSEGEGLLGLRCKERKTEVLITVGRFIQCGSDRIRVVYRLNQGQPIETQWLPASQCTAAFAPAPIPFIRALGDNGRLFIRLMDRHGAGHDGTFELGAVSEVREQIASACKWEAAAPKPAPRPSASAVKPATQN